MTTLKFTKGHGTQNDFVLLFDERGEIDLNQDVVRFLCDRRAGIGADGVIRAVRSGHLDAGAGYDASTWFMDYWNSDGTFSEMCGNGARVFAMFLEREAGVDVRGGITIGTRGGARTVTSLGEGRYAVGMGRWVLGKARDGFDSQVRARARFRGDEVVRHGRLCGSPRGALLGWRRSSERVGHRGPRRHGDGAHPGGPHRAGGPGGAGGRWCGRGARGLGASRERSRGAPSRCW